MAGPAREQGSGPGPSDFARTVCRRAERRVLVLSEDLPNTNILLFLNRLSDLLWLYARHCEAVE